MALSHFTAVYLQHAAQANQFKLQKPEQALAAGGRAEYLLRELKQAFVGKAGKIHGGFSADIATAPLKPWLAELQQEKLSFDSFSDKLWQHFETQLAGSSVDIDGHALLFIESLADADFAHLFILDHKEGLYLDSGLELSDSMYLDMSKIVVAARVNITEALASDFEDTEQASYIAMLRARGDKELTDFFGEYIGMGDALDVKANTDTFLDAVAEFTRDMDDDKAQLCRSEVVDFCIAQDKAGESVQFDQLSDALVESKAVDDEHDFAGFVSQYQEQRDLAKTETLIPDRSKLRNFLRLSGRSDSLSMSFDADCLGSTILYNAADDSLTIKAIPGSLKMRLLQHMQESD